MLKNSRHIDDGDLLDWVKWRQRIFSDIDLSKALDTSSSTISKIRRRHIPLGSVILLRILDLTDVRLKDLPILIEATKSIHH